MSNESTTGGLVTGLISAACEGSSDVEGSSSGLNSDFIIENDEVELLSTFKSSGKSLQEPLDSLYKFCVVGLMERESVPSLADAKSLTSKLSRDTVESSSAAKGSRRPLLLKSTLPVATYKSACVPESLPLFPRGVRARSYSLGGMTFNKENMIWEGTGESYVDVGAFEEPNSGDERAKQDKKYEEFIVADKLQKQFLECEASHKLFIGLWYPRALSMWEKTQTGPLKGLSVTCREYLKLCTE